MQIYVNRLSSFKPGIIHGKKIIKLFSVTRWLRVMKKSLRTWVFVDLHTVCFLLFFHFSRVKTMFFCKMHELCAIEWTWAPGNNRKEWCPRVPSPTAMLRPVAILMVTQCSLCMRVCPPVPPLHEDTSHTGVGPPSQPYLTLNTSRKTKHIGTHWVRTLTSEFETQLNPNTNFRGTHSNESFALSFKICSGT